MRIGVIGTGRVGTTLGTAWAERGHEVTFGSRDPTSEAVATTGQLVREIALEPLHVGSLAMASSLEELAWVWIAWSRTLGRTFLWRIER